MTFLYSYDVPGSSSNFCSIFAEHIFCEEQLSLLILWNNLAYSTNKRTKVESYELLFSASILLPNYFYHQGTQI